MSNDAIHSNDGDLPDHGTERSTPEDAPGGSLTTDDVFELLKNSRRREILYYLEDVDGATPLKELARNIAAREHGIPTSAVSDKQYKRVYVALVQTHVPKMESAGVIGFDDDQTITLRNPSQCLYSHLHLESEAARPPPVDVTETADEIVVRVDLPGFDRDDIHIQATDGRLDIAAERPSSVTADETVIQRERTTAVDRTVPLPLDAVVEGADASYREGVLEITLSKGDATTVIEIG